MWLDRTRFVKTRSGTRLEETVLFSGKILDKCVVTNWVVSKENSDGSCFNNAHLSCVLSFLWFSGFCVWPASKGQCRSLIDKSWLSNIVSTLEAAHLGLFWLDGLSSLLHTLMKKRSNAVLLRVLFLVFPTLWCVRSAVRSHKIAAEIILHWHTRAKAYGPSRLCNCSL